MHQGKEHDADCCGPGPSLVYQKLFQLSKAFKISKASLGKVGHEDDRNDDLIGRQAKKKGSKDHTIQTKGSCKWVQKGIAVAQKGNISYGYIGHDPN